MVAHTNHDTSKGLVRCIEEDGDKIQLSSLPLSINQLEIFEVFSASSLLMKFSFLTESRKESLLNRMDSVFRPKPTSPVASFAVVILVSLSFAAAFVSGDGSPSAYEALEDFDFPVGILPKGLASYELDNSSGKFVARLGGTCKFSIDSYQLEYKATISGVIKKDKILNLKGVSVKVLFLWLNIVEVIRDEDQLQFSVGIASANFEVNDFDESPQCGCGFNCDDFTGFVSSS